MPMSKVFLILFSILLVSCEEGFENEDLTTDSENSSSQDDPSGDNGGGSDDDQSGNDDDQSGSSDALYGLDLMITPNSPLKSFIGAEGFGSVAVGGRGAQVVEVTNLSDDPNDPQVGSLRWALETSSGPRTVIFRVGGTIELKKRIEMKQNDSFVTLAGQTALGDGIQLKNYGLRLGDGVNNVVIRYLKIRMSTNDPFNRRAEGYPSDPLSIYKHNNEDQEPHTIIVDHSEALWGGDENFDANRAHDITVQWSNISEGDLNEESKGILLKDVNRVSIHHNLMAHNQDRNPAVGGKQENAGQPGNIIDIRNNLIYNTGTAKAQFLKYVDANFIGNFFERTSFGPAIGIGQKTCPLQPRDQYLSCPTSHYGKVFVKDNRTPFCTMGDLSANCGGGLGAWGAGIQEFRFPNAVPADESDFRHFSELNVEPFAQVQTSSVLLVKDEVLQKVGADKPVLDCVSKRLREEVTNGTGAIGVDNYGNSGSIPNSAWPNLRTVVLSQNQIDDIDSDRDGIPNEIENLYGLDPQDPADGAGDLDGDGYTNLEEYLNELALDPQVIEMQNCN